jgi:Holliday junction resolvase RusA-like endonuclease
MAIKVYSVTPVAKPRMTRRDKWQVRPQVAQYRAFCDELRLKGFSGQDIDPAGCHILFVFPMPAYWSHKKKNLMVGTPHQQRPDLDNLVKGLWDAVFDDDSWIYYMSAEKRWGWYGKIEIGPL